MTEESGPDGGSVGGRILVVDDHQPNRELLEEMLVPHGYQVIGAGNGEESIRLVSECQPDLVLLDVNMPGMNGFEVCRRLRGDPKTASLPIIMVTALTQREQRLQGIEAGANDYLTKPIDRTDLLLRVRNALQMRRLHADLAAQYRRLRDLEALRDSLVHMVVHDLRSPLTGIMVYVGILQEEVQDPAIRADLEELSRNVRLLTDMVSNVLDVSRFEADAMPLNRVIVDIAALTGEALRSLDTPRRKTTVTFHPPPDPVPAVGDGEVLQRVITNLVANAVKFTPSGGEVRVEVKLATNGAEVRVIDTGPGIPAEYHENIFDKFTQVGATASTGGRSSGLGLTFCKLAVEAHGGRIGVVSEVGMGSTFWFELPSAASIPDSDHHVEGDARFESASTERSQRR